MAIKNLVVLTTLPTDNEQNGVNPRTLTGAGTYYSREFGDFSRLARAQFMLNVTAISAGATLDVTIEGYDAAADIWRTDVTIPQVNAVSTPAPVTADPLFYQIYRVKWVLAGTAPSVTFAFSALGMTEEPVS